MSFFAVLSHGWALFLCIKDGTNINPACGTAGFLISSYKHILKANTDAKGHSTLTPDEKGRLAQNFRGDPPLYGSGEKGWEVPVCLQ